jgi:uncharacterized membrane protein
MTKKILLIGFLLLFLVPIVSAGNLRVISTDYIKSINPCKPASFGFTIQNIGAYSETYYIMVDQFGEYASFSQNPVGLNPSTGQDVFVFINPDCDTTGEYKFNIIVSALNSKEAIMLPVQLNIIENYDYDLLFGDYYAENQPIQASDGNYKVCEEDTKQIPIIVQNKGDLTNSYRISLRGPRFASLTQDTAVLNALQKGAILINLEPKIGHKESYFLTTYVTSQRGNIKKSGTINVNVEECYDVGVGLPKEAVISNCEQSSYEFNIENKGTHAESFNLYLEAPEWVSLNYDAKEIDANSNATATLNFDAPCDKKGTEELTITANSQQHEKIKDTKALALKVIPQNKFYHAIIAAPRRNSIRYDAKEIPIKITNNGFKEISYSLSFVGPEWADIEPRTITLKQKETGDAKLVFNIGEDAEENNYLAAINVTASGASYSKEIVLKLRKAFFSDYVHWFFEDISGWISYYLYYLIAGAILLVGLALVWNPVKRFHYNRSKKFKLVSKFFYIVIIVGIILGGISYLVFFFDWTKIDFNKIGESLYGFFSTYMWYFIAGLIALGVIIWLLVIYEKKKCSKSKKKKVKKVNNKSKKKVKSKKKKSSKKKKK